jgi:putative ABC transport system permease protein
MKSLFKIITRILIRNPVAGFVIIAGFSLSMALGLLLASYILNENEYDRSYPEINRIYRLCTNEGITTFRGDLTSELKRKYPEIDEICRYDNDNVEVSCQSSPYMINNLVKTDSSFFSIFSISIAGGNKEDPVPDNNSIALSQACATLLFGNDDPLGKSVKIQHRKDFIVTSVFDDLPEKSSIKADAIIKWENVNDLGGEWRNGIFYSRLFFLINSNSDPVRLGKKLTTDYSAEHYQKQPFLLMPFIKSYMSPLTANKEGKTLHADLKTIRLFTIITLLIFAISLLNFVILFTSTHLGRLKEIGIKKVNGARKKDIFLQFILEALLITFISFAIAIYLAMMMKPVFSSLVQKEIHGIAALYFPNILAVLLFVAIIGFLAGFYPAVIISRHKPAAIFGNIATTGKLKMKSGLSVLQYLISIVMIISLIVMTRQNNLLTNKDLGFTKEQLINIKVPWEIKEKLPVIKTRLLENPYIESCSVSDGIPGKVSLWNMWDEAGSKYGYNGSLPYFTTDEDFFRVYDAEFILGRGFEKSDWGKSVIINEKAFRLTGWSSIEGKYLKGIPTPEQAFNVPKSDYENNSLKVVGVIKDINVETLNQPVAPTVFECSDHFGVNYLTCRLLPGNYTGTIAYIKKTWQDICPEVLLNFHFYNEWLDTLYESEIHNAYIIRIFTIISIILCCLGTFGIIHFLSRQKIKELGIRKIHGAKIGDIVGILNWSVLKWITIAYAMAIPVSYLVMKAYLKGFAYKVELSLWIFLLAGLLAFLIASATITWISWATALKNPVEVLRYE